MMAKNPYSFQLEVKNMENDFRYFMDQEELRELRSKVIHLETELMLEEQKVNHWKQRYIGLLISGLEAHEIEDYVDELENVD